MKNKKILVIIGIILILAVTLIIVKVVTKENKAINLNVKRDESVDAGPIRDNFNNNIQDLKDAINENM